MRQNFVPCANVDQIVEIQLIELAVDPIEFRVPSVIFRKQLTVPARMILQQATKTRLW